MRSSSHPINQERKTKARYPQQPQNPPNPFTTLPEKLPQTTPNEHIWAITFSRLQKRQETIKRKKTSIKETQILPGSKKTQTLPRKEQKKATPPKKKRRRLSEVRQGLQCPSAWAAFIVAAPSSPATDVAGSDSRLSLLSCCKGPGASFFLGGEFRPGQNTCQKKWEP